MTVVNVVHLMRTYGVHGGERQLFRLFSGKEDSRFRMQFFFLYRDPKCRASFSAIPGLKMEEVLPFSIPPRRSLASEMLLLLLLLPFIQIRLVWMLWHGGANICVAHGVHAAASCWLSAVLLGGKRFVYVHRGTKSEAGRIPLFRLLYAPYDVIAGVSRASADSLRGLGGSKQPITIENGIDCSAYGCNSKDRESHEGPLIFGSVGRLIHGKGQSLLLQAFTVVHRQLEATELQLAGDGPEREELMALALRLGIANAVRFLGQCDDIGRFLAGCDVFVFASESEGLSNSILEAMASGLPSVVVDAPGVSECHINGVTGLVAGRDPKSIAERMLAVAGNDSLRHQLGSAAKQRVETYYSIDANRRRFTELYQALMKAS